MTDLMTTQPWWKTAPNPPCPAEWCERDHEHDEFTAGGTLYCRTVVEHSPIFVVEVQQTVGTNSTEDGYETGPASVYANTFTDDLTPAQVEEFALALLRAVQTIQMSGGTRASGVVQV